MNDRTTVRSAHPVSDEMRATVLDVLDVLERIERELAIAEAHSFAKRPKAPAEPLDHFLRDAVRHFDARPEQRQERGNP